MSDLSSVSDLYLLYSFVSLILIALVIFAMAVTKYLRRCDLEETNLFWSVVGRYIVLTQGKA